MPENILVVDDDAHIIDVISFALKKEGYEVLRAHNGVVALEQLEKNKVSLIVLDIMMPEMDGTQVCTHVRKTSEVPIVFLSSKDEEIDRILGLELGGDDYLTKPFSPRELVARIRAVLRRSNKLPNAQTNRSEQSPQVLCYGKLKIDFEEYKIFWDNQQVMMTVTEFGLVSTLANRPGKVYSRDELVQLAYKDNVIVSDRTIDSHIRRVRSKFKSFGAEPLETVHGIGYKLGSCV
ncbi:hypothetical protein MNBD_GAMMA12-3628 [hydrothermal vent metagenome]|uniref:Two-component transcriptional response regulator, LuxR family n=1 Tax=hydrothermal vent metagenome TaxID=652676 RepID=A0A3B0Y6N8_9ZZZZ